MTTTRNAGARGATLVTLLVLVGIVGLLPGLASPPARAAIELDITKGQVQPLPIAIPGFIGAAPDEGKFGADIADDHRRQSRSFRAFPPAAGRVLYRADQQFQSAALASATGAPSRPRPWSPARSSCRPDGRLRAEFRLWDVYSQTQVPGFQFVTSPKNWRRMGHMISDAIYKALTGEDGYFDTRIVFIQESGPKDKRVKRLAIMDQDGANIRQLTDGKDLVLTPRFNPTAQEITYMSYAGNKPRIYLYNIETQQREIVGEFPHMNFAPRFSPDGQRLVMSFSRGRQFQHLRDRPALDADRQLTNSAAIDTAPCFSPDGSRIIFESDRGGTQQLYVMNGDGSEPAADQLRRRPLCDAGLVAARRPHRLHQDQRRTLPSA